MIVLSRLLVAAPMNHSMHSMRSKCMQRTIYVGGCTGCDIRHDPVHLCRLLQRHLSICSSQFVTGFTTNMGAPLSYLNAPRAICAPCQCIYK